MPSDDCWNDVCNAISDLEGDESILEIMLDELFGRSEWPYDRAPEGGDAKYFRLIPSQINAILRAAYLVGSDARRLAELVDGQR